MKALIISILTLISSYSFGQTAYEKAMGKALSDWQSGKATEAIGQFERIAQAEKSNWIPKYYQGLVGVTESFKEQDADKKQKQIETSKALIPTDEKELNAEWLVLKALALTSELTIDPMATAMLLSPQIIELYEKALKMEPNNPRALSGLADFQIQSKKFMGGDTKQECKDLEKAVSLFSQEKHATKFYPTWGKERAEMLLKACK
ncbi:hypothetical protein ACP6L2_14095 [Sphingobacterium lactis]|uniref:hypothetical protein n=1 Tax=Sphingobacterium lactis TaxID=797291 RepID=UPI003F7D7778